MSNGTFGVGVGFGVGLVALIGIGVSLVGCPQYNVYSAKLEGEAELAKATQNKQVLVETAKAEKEAEVLRAEGTAEANKIVGKSLEGNEAYLRWLWINKLNSNGDKTVVYVPTDGMVPSLETGRVAGATK